MNSLISVIVPIYKVEKYLRKCVESILSQTHTNLEIILVDDGSPDNCGAICDEYAKQDARIKVIHKPNGGLSDARNAGLDIMTGEYVAFVDSDDWIGPRMYETLLQMLKLFQADIAIGGVADELEQNGKVTTVKVTNYREKPFYESATEAMHRFFTTSWAAWDKLYKADLFWDIRYPVGEINEDEAIVLQLLSKCTRVCYTNEVFYHYMRRPSSGSITAASFSVKKLAWQAHCRDNLEFVQAHYPALVPDAAARYRGSLLWSLTEIALSDENYAGETQALLSALRSQKKLFYAAPFSYRQDRLRMWLLLHFPFFVYRAIIRFRRS